MQVYCLNTAILFSSLLQTPTRTSRIPIGLCRCLQNVNKICNAIELLRSCTQTLSLTNATLFSCAPNTHDAGIHASLITRVPAFVHSTTRRGLPCRSCDKNDADDGSIAIAHCRSHSKACCAVSRAPTLELNTSRHWFLLHLTATRRFGSAATVAAIKREQRLDRTRRDFTFRHVPKKRLLKGDRLIPISIRRQLAVPLRALPNFSDTFLPNERTSGVCACMRMYCVFVGFMTSA